MAVVKKIMTGKSAAPAALKKPTMELPTGVNVPPSRFSDYSMLLYGRKKIGKTSLCAQMPGAYFIATEPGTKALKVRASQVKTFDDIDGLIKLLEQRVKEGKPYCETLVWDTIDLVYDLAWDKVCKAKMINHPSEERDFGATWKEIRDLFRSVVVRSLKLGCGVVFVSHDTEKEVELPDGSKIERRMPTMATKAMSEIEGIVDIIGFYEYSGEKRSLHIQGSDTLVAGCRCKWNFKTTAGERIRSIDMGNSEEESMRNLQRAFDNKQTTIDAFVATAKKPISIRKN
jgi:hypothetical protein